jgi:hypothetical protein
MSQLSDACWYRQACHVFQNILAFLVFMLCVNIYACVFHLYFAFVQNIKRQLYLIGRAFENFKTFKLLTIKSFKLLKILKIILKTIEIFKNSVNFTYDALNYTQTCFNIFYRLQKTGSSFL